MGKEVALTSKEKCTGCGACKAICPKRAIEFDVDNEGFPSPVVDGEKCVNCGLCEKICPALNMPETHTVQAAYAAQLKDKDALKNSTSGGVFTALAREIFRRGGVVYGCVWDKNYNAVTRKAENEEEMVPMRGSKYVWSWAGDTFKEIRDYLEVGRIVMFTGLPCQVSGLKAYLRKSYKNLILVDFLCSGAPSPIALKSYLKTICNDYPLEKLNLKFRDKDPYGVGVNITYNGQKRIGRKKGQHISNPYYYSFYIRLIDRLSCYTCKYGTDQRVSDLTIGDYWGVGMYHPDLNIRDGISALMVNTENGRELFDSISQDVIFASTEVDKIAKGNNLSLGEAKQLCKPKNREAFLRMVSKEGWKAAERRYLYDWTRLKLWLKMKIPSKYINEVKKIIKGR